MKLFIHKNITTVNRRTTYKNKLTNDIQRQTTYNGKPTNNKQKQTNKQKTTISQLKNIATKLQTTYKDKTTNIIQKLTYNTSDKQHTNTNRQTSYKKSNQITTNKQNRQI